MSDRAFSTGAITLSTLQPGLFGIRPMVSEGDDGRLPNPAIQKVADDVLAAARLSLTAVVAAPESRTRENSAEGALAMAIRTLPSARAARPRAEALLAADAAGGAVHFGRFAGRGPDAVRDSGFARLVEDERPVAVDLKAFGLREPQVTIPLGALRRTAGGGFEIAPGTPGLPGPEIGPEAAGGAGEVSFEATASARRSDFEAALRKGDVGDMIDRERFAAQWGQLTRQDPFAAGTAAEDFEPQLATTDKLRLWTRTVRCNDETNPEWPGDDEIALAGVSIDEDGDTKPIGERFVGSGFSDGTTRSPNWDFHSFSLRERSFWPKKFGITLILAEKDNGGLSAFLQRLWEQTRDTVHKALANAAQAAGVALSTFLGVPEFGPLIGSALAAAANYVVDKLVDWLISLFQDDIFRPYTAWVNIPSMSARWSFPNGTWGSQWGPLRTVTYTGFGGQYALTYQWQLYA